MYKIQLINQETIKYLDQILLKTSILYVDN